MRVQVDSYLKPLLVCDPLVFITGFSGRATGEGIGKPLSGKEKTRDKKECEGKTLGRPIPVDPDRLPPG